MIPRRSECIFCDKPAGREDDEVGDCRARNRRRSREDGEDGGVGVVIGDATNSIKAAEVVFVGIIGAVPRYNIERSMALFGSKEVAIELRENGVLRVGRGMIFNEIRGRGLKVPCISQAIGTNGPELRELEVALVELENITSCRTVRE